MLGKVISVIVVAVMTVVTLRRAMKLLKANAEAAKVRVTPEQGAPDRITRLRLDPETGVYRPE